MVKNRITKKSNKAAAELADQQAEIAEEQAPEAAEAESQTVEPIVAEDVPTVPGSDEQPAAEAASTDAAGPSEAAESAESSESSDETDAAAVVAESAPEEPAAPVSPFALVFKAPDLASLPPLPAVDSYSDDDDDDDDDDRDHRGGRKSRRGRSRTRRGRGQSDDDREPITEPQKVQGSTRLEAKRQRRRDGRDAGRRRTVVTESEFLARRESVERSMIVRSMHDRVQLGVLEDGVLVEHYVAKSSESSMIGDVFLGRVQNVLPSMEAAFVDIGRGRNAVLYSGEVDWAAAELDGQPRRIENALKPGDTVLVQVTKDPVGHKGARLTSQVSLPGRYLVSVPGGAMNGISRKLPDTERARLKKILKQVLPQDVGVIVRTAAEGATEDQLRRDVERLTKQWTRIQEQAKSGKSPQRLHGEPDLLVKIIRDVFNEDFTKLVIQGAHAHTTITEYLEAIAPELLERVEAYEGTDDPFDHFRIKEQIQKALDRKVWLPSGGSLVIDRTEAMTVVDVNTGRFVGQGGNLEETVTKNNLEAAEEIVRQLRLRDIGGIIVIDFIDMVLESNRDLVLRRLVECLGRDRTKHQVAEVTSLGLVQMTRKKLGLGLLEAYSEPCEACATRGIIVHAEPIGKGSKSDGGRSKRGRGGRRDQQEQKQSAPTPKHEITDDARKGLSQIASAGRKPEDGDGAESDASADEAPKQPAKGEQSNGRERQQKEQPAARESRSRRSSPRRASTSGVVAAPAADSEPNAQQSEPAAKSGSESADDVRILDIPVASAQKPEREPQKILEDIDGLLSGALDKLQQPEPGTGRVARRSRRASSGVIRTNDAE
ncbi:Rne/Rng family ribonuclease [Agrococcus casei]|uniref:Rne/Rng family ribonuclease n=1 Tax=Agrococcus casei TaxID=343512 RepID=UPI003F91B55F